jgi:hypothetical protein
VTVAGESAAIRVVLRLQGCDMRVERCERGEELVWGRRASTIDAFASGIEFVVGLVDHGGRRRRLRIGKYVWDGCGMRTGRRPPKTNNSSNKLRVLLYFDCRGRCELMHRRASLEQGQCQCRLCCSFQASRTL